MQEFAPRLFVRHHQGKHTVHKSIHYQPKPAAGSSEHMQNALDGADWPLLVRLCQQRIRKNRMDLKAHRLLGFSLNKRRQTQEALSAFQQGAALHPNDAELLINYANVLIEHVRNAEALPLLERVCALRPTQAISWLKLSECCYLLTLHERGFEAALRGANLAQTDGTKALALMQKAIHRRELGQIREAIEDCEAAIALNPLSAGDHTNRLLFMLADPNVSAAQVTAAAREYGAAFEPPLKPLWPHFAEHRGDPWRRLKIGFISPDFRAHAVMYSVEGLLAQLDRRQFEVHAYYMHASGDHITERVERHADHFVRMAGFSIDEQLQRIRDDGIDILIDLAGHTGGNALLTLAHKAAPVQVSWLGYPATTGLEAVDYKFTDEVTDPPDADAQYTERLYRLPTLFACYRPMSRQPLWRYQPRYLVRPTPALVNGFITFGSCNNLGKLTDGVLTVWGRILQAVPQARLLIEGKNLGQPEFAASYRQRCAGLGLDPDRLDLLGLHTDNQYLTYHRIDIALDPFPLTGGTTTFDVLWMGVPLVSMVGASFKSRIGTGMLTHLGRTEWLAEDADQYVQIARQLAADPQQLNALRLGLRTEVEQSPLMREDLFTHFFSEGLRTMWLQWLAQAEHPGDSAAQLQAMEQWLTQLPSEWGTPAPPGVGLEPGTRVSLPMAHQLLQSLLDKAKAEQPQQQAAHGQIDNKHWAAVTNLAETVLSAVPHDAVALTCLAEVEFAHGHTQFALTYLRYAQESMARAAAT
jgi:protein O-GlcNAc transferase